MANSVACQLHTSSSGFTVRARYRFSENWHPTVMTRKTTNLARRMEGKCTALGSRREDHAPNPETFLVQLFTVPVGD
jgi:hypothetical protein